MLGLKTSRCVGVLVVVGFGALLAACGPSKEEKLLMEENTALHKAVDDQGMKIGQLETKVNEIAARPQPPIDTYTPPGNDPGKGSNRNRPTGGGETITLAGTNLFPSGSDQLTVEGKKSVDSAIAKIKSQHAGASITVEGYSDSTPIKKAAGKFPTNEALSQARAETVRKYMATKGISSSRITAVGYGAVSKNGKPPSRRVEIVIQD